MQQALQLEPVPQALVPVPAVLLVEEVVVLASGLVVVLVVEEVGEDAVVVEAVGAEEAVVDVRRRVIQCDEDAEAIESAWSRIERYPRRVVTLSVFLHQYMRQLPCMYPRYPASLCNKTKSPTTCGPTIPSQQTTHSAPSVWSPTSVGRAAQRCALRSS